MPARGAYLAQTPSVAAVPVMVMLLLTVLFELSRMCSSDTGTELLSCTAVGVPEAGFRYLVLPLFVVKLGIGHVLFTMQVRGFELHQWFGLPARNGAMLAVALYFVGQRPPRCPRSSKWA